MTQCMKMICGNYSCDLNFRVECSLNNAIKTLKKHPVAIPMSLIKKCMIVNIDAIDAIFKQKKTAVYGDYTDLKRQKK